MSSSCQLALNIQSLNFNSISSCTIIPLIHFDKWLQATKLTYIKSLQYSPTSVRCSLRLTPNICYYVHVRISSFCVWSFTHLCCKLTWLCFIRTACSLMMLLLSEDLGRVNEGVKHLMFGVFYHYCYGLVTPLTSALLLKASDYQMWFLIHSKLHSTKPLLCNS